MNRAPTEVRLDDQRCAVEQQNLPFVVFLPRFRPTQNAVGMLDVQPHGEYPYAPQRVVSKAFAAQHDCWWRASALGCLIFTGPPGEQTEGAIFHVERVIDLLLRPHKHHAELSAQARIKPTLPRGITAVPADAEGAIGFKQEAAALAGIDGSRSHLQRTDATIGHRDNGFSPQLAKFPFKAVSLKVLDPAGPLLQRGAQAGVRGNRQEDEKVESNHSGSTASYHFVFRDTEIWSRPKHLTNGIGLRVGICAAFDLCAKTDQVKHNRLAGSSVAAITDAARRTSQRPCGEPLGSLDCTGAKCCGSTSISVTKVPDNASRRL